MRNMAFASLVAMGFMAAGALAQQQPSPSQSTNSSARQPGSTGQSGTRDRRATGGSRSTTPQTTPSGRADTQTPVTFDEADKDKDGKLTRREARRVPNLSFSSADADRDSAVSRQEFQIAMASAGERPRG